jgi:geranylgeranyl diphosphate synthase type II
LLTVDLSEAGEPWRRRQDDADAALAAFLVESRARAVSLGADYAGLWDTIERNTRGGKRFRPLMVLGAYEALSAVPRPSDARARPGDERAQAAQIAAAFELLHTALIVHDDVIDRDFVRRGRLNVSGSYREIATTAGIPLPAAEQRGISAAVIAGDLALSAAHRLIERSGVDADARAQLLDILDEAVFVSAAGELADVDFSMRAEPPTVAEIVEMERAKTAVYSFEAPLAAGAVLAGASDEVVEALRTFGRNIGVAYQIVDDLLGVFGDEGDTGKTTLGDLREGKRTVLYAHASAHPDWPLVAPLFGNGDLRTDQADEIRDVFERAGSRRFAEALARDFANRAW